MATEVTSGAAVISPQPRLPTELLTKCTHLSDVEPRAQPSVASLKGDSPMTCKEAASTLETRKLSETPSNKPQFASYLPQPVMPIGHSSALQASKTDSCNKSPQLSVYLSDEMSNVLTIQGEAQMFEDRPSKLHSQSISSVSSASSDVPSLVSSQRSSQDLTSGSPGADSCSVQPISPKNTSEDPALLPTFSQLDSQLPSALKTKGFSLPKLQAATKLNPVAAKLAERPREQETLERKKRHPGEQATPFKHISTEPPTQQAISIQPARVIQSTRRIAKKPEKVKKHEPKRKHPDNCKGPRVVLNSEPKVVSHHAGHVPFHSVQPPSGQPHPPLLSPMHIPYDQSLHPIQMPLPQMFQHPSYPYAVQSSLMIGQHPVHQMQPTMPPPMWPPNQQLSPGINTAVQMPLMLPQPGQAVHVSAPQPEPSTSLPDLHDSRQSLHPHGPHHFPVSMPPPHPASHYPLQGYPQVLAQSESASQPGPRLVPFQPFQESLLSDQSRSSSLSPQQQTSSFANSTLPGNVCNQTKTKEPWDIEVVGSSSWQPGFTQDIKMRTKTGCLTCRRRRVKCDEKRPHCRNCLKSERVCLGYDTVFTRARNKRIEDLSSKRRACRNSWKMRISALLEAGHAESEDDDTSCFGTRPVVVRTWLRLVELFRDHVARDLDLLLGTDFLLVTAHRGANHLSSHNGSLISMASELEAMRQIMVVVFPTVESSTLNILDANLPLEKLKTSDGYYVMQAIVESLSPDFRDHLAVPTRITKRQQHDQPELMETWFMRLTLLGKLLHPQKGRFFPFSWKHRYTLYEMASQVLKAADEDDASFTKAVWHVVGILLDLESKHPAEAMQYSPPATHGEAEQVLMAKSQEAALKLRQIADKGDARGVLALLALSRGGCEMAQQAMTSLQTLSGLALALSEIPMLSMS